MPTLTGNDINRLLREDPNVTDISQGDDPMGGHIDAVLSDGRAVEIVFHDNPAWRQSDEKSGRIEILYLNRSQTEWRFDDNDFTGREHTIIDPARPGAIEKLMRALQDWEREGGLAVGRPVTSGHTAPPSPPEEYAYRWHNRIGPGWHIEYRSTAVDRDLAMRRKTDEGYFTQRIEEDPTVLYEEHRKAACLRAGRILARRTSADVETIRLLHTIVNEVSEHRPTDDLASYRIYPSADAIRLAGDGLTSIEILEKREYGGWNPDTDPLMHINEQGDWTGISQAQADGLVWAKREEILDHAAYDDGLSPSILHRLDELEGNRPVPEREPERERHHGLNL